MKGGIVKYFIIFVVMSVAVTLGVVKNDLTRFVLMEDTADFNDSSINILKTK